MFKSIAKMVMTFLFFGAAAVQYNDPDPMLWIGIYYVCGLWTILSHGNRNGLISICFAVTGFSLAAQLCLHIDGEMNLFETEKGREMMGLGIIGIWFSILAVWDWPRETPPSHE